MTAFDFSKLRVLVVDDNVHMCRLVRTMLSAFGLRHVAEAHDGAEALERIGQSNFDILVVDWEMPVLNGPDLVKFIRKPDHALAFVPIIMITGHSTYRRTQEALALGVNDVLCKPFSPKALYIRIADSIFNPRPFLRTQDYFGPKPRLDPSERDPLALRVRMGSAHARAMAGAETGADTGAGADAIDVDTFQV